MFCCICWGKYLYLKFNCKGMLFKNLFICVFIKVKIGKIDVMCMLMVYLNSFFFKKDL